MNVFRSILAIAAGLAVVAIGSTATDWLLQRAGIFPAFQGQSFAAPLLLIATAHRAVWGVAGGFVTALLAPFAPVRHAVLLGAIGAILSGAGGIVMWRAGAHWYPILLAIISIPTAWLGAVLSGRRRHA